LLWGADKTHSKPKGGKEHAFLRKHHGNIIDASRRKSQTSDREKEGKKSAYDNSSHMDRAEERLGQSTSGVEQLKPCRRSTDEG